MTRSRGGPRVASLGAAAMVLLAATAATAADGTEEGRRHYRRGQERMKVGDWRGAAEAFEAGHAAAPRVGFLVNIGNCYRKLGELGKARQYYWRFLDAAPRDHSARQEVIGYLRAMEQIEADGVSVDAPPSFPRPPPALSPPPLAPSTEDALGLRDRASPAAGSRRPLVGRWWFWAVVGGALATGATAYALAQPGAAACRASLGCAREGSP